MKEETYQLIYTSQATSLLSVDQLREIDQKATFYNPIHDITGILLYAEGLFSSKLQGRFLGVLEGSFEALEKLARIIQKDGRHFNLVVLYMGLREHRDYMRWRLGYRKKENKNDIISLDEFFDIDLLFAENDLEKEQYLSQFTYFENYGNSMSGS
ncbi:MULTISPECIES: BLUF domain-containing protein [Olivibacter]|uniref:BLUF domain-containing protein n=1 Tax=Olivibacter jilunii TaxID=985016 RepID=A0ABW6B8X1_9SPHI|nr:BLUF domain-containing protein [Pseudosphingobacterium sp.]